MVRSLNTGPAGMVMMLAGLLLAASSACRCWPSAGR